MNLCIFSHSFSGEPKRCLVRPFIRSAFAFTPPSVTVIKIVCRASAAAPPPRANCTALINAREIRAKKKGNDSSVPWIYVKDSGIA